MSIWVKSARLRLSAEGGIVIVLDGSESAVGAREKIAKLGTELAAKIGAAHGNGLYLLGDGTRRMVRSPAAAIWGWLRDASRRPSVIAPIMRHFERGGRERIVLIGAGRVFDLEDWKEWAALRRGVRVSFAEEREADGWPGEWMDPGDATDLLTWARDPVVRVRIEGPAFLPLSWDNDGYSLVVESGSARLTWAGEGDASIGVEYASDCSAEAMATVTTASGRECAVPLAECDRAISGGVARRPLGVGDRARLVRARGRQNISCARCGGLHEWSAVTCQDSESIVEPFAYDALGDGDRGRICVFRIDGDRAEIETSVKGAVLLERARAVVYERGKARIYELDGDEARWVVASDVEEQYLRLDEARYAIFL